MIIGFSGTAAPLTAEPRGQNDSIQITTEEASELRRLISAEESTAKAAHEASRSRDAFCQEIERRYSIKGHGWKVDFDKKRLILN